MSATRPNASRLEEVIGQLVGAQDLPQALSIFFDSVLSPEGVEGAIVLLREEGELRGSVAMGCDVYRVRKIAIPLGGRVPLALAFERGEPAEVPPPFQAGKSGADRFLAVTVPGAARGDPPLGMILLGSPSCLL